MKKILAVALAAALALIFAGVSHAGNKYAAASKYKRPASAEPTSSTGKHETPGQMESKISEDPGYHKKVKASDFPEKGWHKGPYLAANIGMMQVTNDKHAVTGRKFDGTFDLNFGLTFGWDITDWIGPMLQINYATATGTVGNGTATYPTENARQHAMDISLFAKATLPYFTTAEWQWKNLKILPYAKLGGTGHAMYVNAPNTNNKIGAYGGGPAVGLGCEFFIWKGFFFAIDATENLIFQGSYSRTINGVNTKVIDGGFKPQFVFAGLIGWHF